MFWLVKVSILGFGFFWMYRPMGPKVIGAKDYGAIYSCIKVKVKGVRSMWIMTIGG
jgi:hypothetical protein